MTFARTCCALFCAVPAIFALPPILPAGAQTKQTTPDKSISYTLPKDWTATTQGGKTSLTAPGGDHYLLLYDTIAAPSSGDLTRSDTLLEQVELVADGILADTQFLSVRGVATGTGSGARFRYKEKGKSGEEAGNTEIWVAIIDKHSLVLTPRDEGQKDQSVEIAAIFASLAPIATATAGNTSGAKTDLSGSKQRNTPTPTNGMEQRNTSTATTEKEQRSAPTATTGTYLKGDIPKSNDTSSAAITPAAKPKSKDNQSVAFSPQKNSKAAVLEGYSGHLMRSDVSFTLRLMQDGTVKSEWNSATAQKSQFSGSYSGKMGEYVIELSQEAGNNCLGARTLHLTMHAQGSAETGFYTADDDGQKYAIARLELTEISSSLKGAGTGSDSDNFIAFSDDAVNGGNVQQGPVTGVRGANAAKGATNSRSAGVAKSAASSKSATASVPRKHQSLTSNP